MGVKLPMNDTASVAEFRKLALEIFTIHQLVGASAIFRPLG